MFLLSPPSFKDLFNSDLVIREDISPIRMPVRKLRGSTERIQSEQCKLPYLVIRVKSQGLVQMEGDRVCV